MIAAILFVLAVTGAPDASMSVGPPQGRPMTGAALDTKTAEVASLLRCPVCQGMSIADSPSEMAVNMKHQVRALLERGYTQEQILDYFERSYGQFVLLKPRFQGVNALVWLLPLAALAIGAAVVMAKAKRLQKPSEPGDPATRRPVSRPGPQPRERRQAVTDWVSASAILAAGIVLGIMFIYFVKRRPEPIVASTDSDLRDLEAKRDALVQQLRGLDPSNADERTRLEIETAQVLRRIDERRKVERQAPPVTAAVSSDPLRRATMIGFGWGAGSMLILAALGYLVMQSAKPREQNASLTGGETTTTMRPAQPPPDPAVQQLEAAVKKSPDDLNARIDLAKAYLERDNLMGVFDQTQYVLVRSPNEPRALTYQALVRMAMGQGADAVGMLERATKADPSLLDAWVALAWANTTAGKTKQAEAAIAEAERRHPEEKARLEQVYAAMKQQVAARKNSGGELPVSHPAIGAAEEPVENPIHVTLELDPASKGKLTPTSVVFVIARPEGVAAGPPAAVKRLTGVTFPITFDLSAADSMMGQPLPPRVRLEARIDADGNAMTKDPSDPVGVQDGVALGATVRLHLK